MALFLPFPCTHLGFFSSFSVHPLHFPARRVILFQRKSHGVLAQLVARDIRIVEARGSTPLYSTKQKKSELDSYRERVRIFSLELYTKTNITLNVKESV